MENSNIIEMHEFQNQMTNIIFLLKNGNQLILTENNEPIAKISPIVKNKRIAGLYSGDLEFISDDFDSELSDEFWYGKKS
jgi:antitoxin (DNA-binding transcriptional repressor) of toxin-antitoxin stability system